MLGYCLKIMFQIVFQTLLLFMVLWMTLFHDRWENFRDFMTRTYSPESVIYLSGFVIITALMVTTFGTGLNTASKLFCRILTRGSILYKTLCKSLHARFSLFYLDNKELNRTISSTFSLKNNNFTMKIIF